MVVKNISAAFPSELHSQAKAVDLALKLPSDHDYGYFSVNVRGETLFIPNRISSPPIGPDLSRLSLEQRRMAQCILTRSTDGFERQVALQEVQPANEP